jgi:hypothetical protein
MAKKGASNGKAEKEDSAQLPERFAAWKASAEEHRIPEPDCNDAIALPELFALLSPCTIKDQRYRGEGKIPHVLTEPLLMISWDRAAGCWSWSVGIKQLNIRLSGKSETLLRLLEEANDQLLRHACIVKEIRTV